MSHNRSFLFLVLASSVCAAVGVTVYAPTSRADGDGVLPVTTLELAQAEGAVGKGEVTEGPAQPEMEDEHVSEPAQASTVAPSTSGQTGQASPADPESVGPTDHQRVVGSWGIEARSVALVESSRDNPDPACSRTEGTASTCREVRITSIGIRRWMSERYAYSAGLAVSVGGGSTKDVGTWDTHFGVGPTAGAFFLLSQWKHLAVSATPQLALMYFAPSGRGNKTFSVDVQGKVEAELQLGFMGLPGFAVGTDAGLAVRYMNVSNDDQDVGGYSRWGINTVGTSTPWGLVTNAFLRFYL